MSTAAIEVTGLNVYPVKSMRATPLARVRLSATGLEWDRQWMVVDGQGTFLSQRTHPQLARIVPEVRDETLVLSAPGLGALAVPLRLEGTPVPVRVWDDACAGLEQGSEAHEWVSRALGQPVRLVRVAPGFGRRANPRFAGAVPAPVTFADGYPVLVCNEASLDDLNDRLPQRIPMERFRPNIVLRGLPAWAEDRIHSLTIGPVTLRLVKPCVRCVIPSIDQRTGERSTDPTPALRKFRFNKELRGVMFGENAVVVAGSGERLERGAPVEARFEA
ncbi:MAG TPA: MOSC N-terminal beta barrel domain-containing protein [Steroidobacteraceae bacterium]|nr:MOSC N-terminal beta barrel domain-containing protein [Steroidobacteraceae bacterium]